MVKRNQTHRRVGQVLPKGDNKWLIRIYRGKNQGGKKQFHNETVKGTKMEAEKFLRVRLAEFEAGTLIRPSKETLNDFLDHWLDLRRPALAERTYDDYCYLMERYIRPILGARAISSVSQGDIQAVYTGMLERKLGCRTIRYTHTVINAALKSAVKGGLIKSNPADGAHLPKMINREMRALTPEEIKIFLKAIEGDRYKVVFILALDSGMRPEEYLALKWEDVDFDRGSVAVRRTLCRRRREAQTRGGSMYLGLPKTSKSRRTIPLCQNTVSCLRSHRPVEWDPSQFVFLSKAGTPILADNLCRHHFKPALKRAKLPNIRLYDLRHTMATALLVAGVNPKIVSERLGHSSIVLTLDKYSHVIPGLQEMAAQKLKEILFG